MTQPVDNNTPADNTPAQTGSNAFFENDHLRKDLKGRSVRGGAATTSAQVVKFASQIGTTFLLARFLTPEDFGLVGMVTVVLVFIDFFKNLGLSTATMQKDNLTHTQVNTLFWLNAAFGCLTALIAAASAPVIASFYGEPQLISITLVLSTTFFLSSLSIQHSALLQRQMQFSHLAKVDVAAISISSIAAIASAALGANYWAIIVGRVSQVTVTVVATWLCCRWRPGLPAWDESVKSMIAFGANIAGFNLVNYFSRNLDNILIGRVWGVQELGLYAIAYRILLLPIQQINGPMTAVALPALSRLQKEPEEYKKYYFKALQLMTTVGMPVVGLSVASAGTFIPLFLGQQWSGVVPIFRLLAPAAFFGTFNVATGWVFISLGKANRQLYQGIAASITNVIVFLICIRWGAVGMAAGFSLSRLLIRIPSILYCYQGTPLTLLALTKALFPQGLSAILSASLTAACDYALSSQLPLAPTALIDIVLYITFYCGLLMIIPNGKETLYRLFKVAKFLSKAKSIAPTQESPQRS